MCVCYLHTHLALRPSLDSLATAALHALREKGVRRSLDLRRTYSQYVSVLRVRALFAYHAILM